MASDFEAKPLHAMIGEARPPTRPISIPQTGHLHYLRKTTLRVTAVWAGRFVSARPSSTRPEASTLWRPWTMVWAPGLAFSWHKSWAYPFN